jgi:hypothetical protein
MLLLAAVTVVCLTTEPIRNGHARVILELGQVSVVRGMPQALFVGNDIKQQERIVTGHDGYAKFQVADGSTFEVFPDSNVVFHDNPTVTYRDLLNVWIGHIRVIIKHLNGPNYNSVTTPTAVISVRGTIFDVVVEDDDGTTAVAVDEGLVQVRNLTAPGKEPFLQPGDEIRIYRGQPLLGKMVDHSGTIRAALQVVQDTIRGLTQRAGGGVGLPGGGGGVPGTGGAQGDKGKNTGGSGTGSSTGSQAPPSGPPAGSGGGH